MKNRAVMLLSKLLWCQGLCPVTISMAVQPMLQTSDFSPCPSERHTSGAIHRMVPESFVGPSWGPFLREQPKSVSFKTVSIFFWDTRMLAHLMSPWMMPMRCRYNSPARICFRNRRTTHSGMKPHSSSIPLRAPPGMYSMKMDTLVSSSVPRYLTMLGWWRPCRICTSLASASACEAVNPSASFLMAMSCPSSRLMARYTSAKPPWATIVGKMVYCLASRRSGVFSSIMGSGIGVCTCAEGPGEGEARVITVVPSRHPWRGTQGGTVTLSLGRVGMWDDAGSPSGGGGGNDGGLMSAPRGGDGGAPGGRGTGGPGGRGTAPGSIGAEGLPFGDTGGLSSASDNWEAPPAIKRRWESEVGSSSGQ
mmetsp:Transcript_84372/g.140688  ORF Transcript_84372/g.140688 Transcript_84372/m.140688 type:complete len:364 (+) Transcript_84372:485-1576(+)